MVRMKIILMGDPKTKKNSRRIFESNGKRISLPSAAYEEYQDSCLWQIGARYREKITRTVWVEYLYYPATERRVDLDNLVVGTNDILVKAKVLPDDGRAVIREISAKFMETDRHNTRVEITILEDDEDDD